jgi:hypothetical protein
LNPKSMADLLNGFAQQKRPSEVVVPGLLEGLDNISRLVHLWTSEDRHNDQGEHRASG